MPRIEGVCRDVVEKSEWVAIATTGPNGPHLVATWGAYIRASGVEGEELIIPAGRFLETEENLKLDPRVELLFASRKVKREEGRGQGCCVAGKGRIETSGVTANTLKSKFPWARGALIVTIEKVSTQL